MLLDWSEAHHVRAVDIADQGVDPLDLRVVDPARPKVSQHGRNVDKIRVMEVLQAV